MKTSILGSTAAIFALVAVKAALGQVTAYELIDLGVLPSASPSESRAFAISNLHEIAGQAYASNGKPHAAVWLFCANYGLTAQQWHDLSPSAETAYSGWALSINEAGLLAGGQVIHAHGSLNRPYVWDLVTPANSLELSTFYDDPGNSIYGTGNAWAVNNASPALVVGQAQFPGLCGGESRAFLYIEGNAGSAIDNLGTSSGDSGSRASGINDATPSEAAGVSETPCLKVGSCHQNSDAVNWTLSTPPALTDLFDSGGAQGALAWGINDASQTVGSFLTTDIPCRVHAAFWESSTAVPVDLGLIGIAATDESVAFKLNNVSPDREVTVVGRNESTLRAWRWHRDSSGDWSVGGTGINLNLLISPLCGWVLNVARDISDDGWIVGEGGVGLETHGFLLRPVVCSGDLDHSGLVDGADLGLLLGAWGCTLAPCAMCRADLNLDAMIDGADLGILLGKWGAECEQFACPGEASEMQSSQNQSDAESALLQGLSLLGFGSVQDFNAWRLSASEQDAQSAQEWLLLFLTHES